MDFLDGAVNVVVRWIFGIIFTILGMTLAGAVCWFILYKAITGLIG